MRLQLGLGPRYPPRRIASCPWRLDEITSIQSFLHTTACNEISAALGMLVRRMLGASCLKSPGNYFLWAATLSRSYWTNVRLLLREPVCGCGSRKSTTQTLRQRRSAALGSHRAGVEGLTSNV
ncbi:hypothetical protein EVAR_88981_1 [Eumeta japonica]|uniref:Uncharacterized protein n=1 Tax=Eumeta variegata TaxID=151549 RepID=A0A4C1VQX0_EUMVA|nr:hypothetical protein EVAR_88981_1 [Eumeta japonica]